MAFEMFCRLAEVEGVRLDAAMLSTIVFTVFGPDRPGLVEAVSACTATQGGNWLESRMLRLGGHFAGIVRVEIEDEKRGDLVAALQTLETTGLRVAVQDASDGPGIGGEAAGPGTRLAIEVVGHDRPGIVRKLSQVLAANGVNVEELETERTSAPMTGEPIFKAQAEVLLPEGVDASTLRDQLEAIAADLMVDLEFRPGSHP